MTEEGTAACFGVVENNGTLGVTWVHLYVSEDKQRIYRVYDGPSPEAIRTAAARNGLPVDRIPGSACSTRTSTAQAGQTSRSDSMKLLISVVSCAALAGLTLAGAGSAAAHGSENSTCAEVEFLDVHVHGDHVIRDYVGDVGQGEGGADLPGGPGPGFHFTIDGLAPGASFCNPQAHPNGFDTPDNVPVPGNGS